MRAALLARSAAAIYAQGITALEPPDGPAIETTTFSTPGGTRRVMELLSQSNHDRASRLVQPLAIASLVLAGVVLLLGNGFSRFAGLGLAMIGGAVLVLVGALLVKFAIAFVGSDGTVLADEFSRLLDTAAWAPIRNAIVFGGGGVALLVPAWLLSWFFDRSLVRPAPVIDGPSGSEP
jgi:protein-S-isoprenylcysteine O-methyltransferase Ste14